MKLNPCPNCGRPRHIIMVRQPDKSLSVDTTCLPPCDVLRELEQAKNRIAVFEKAVKHLEAGI